MAARARRRPPSPLVVGGRSRLVLVNNVVATLANVALALVLIPRYGMVGAGFATTAAFAVQFICLNWMLIRRPTAERALESSIARA